MTDDIQLNAEKIKSTQLRFWLFQMGGWLPFFGLLLPVFGDDNLLSNNALLFALSITIIAIFGSLQLRRLFHFLVNKIKMNSLWIVVIFFSCLIVAMIVGGIHHGLWHIISIGFSEFTPIYQNQSYFSISGLVWFVYVFWSSLYLLFTNQEKLRGAEMQQKQLELLIKETKIKSLLEQLNPHFMFNTINNIRTLILQDTDKAREMLSSFADIMRYQINSNNEAMVLLKDELAFVLEYVELNRLQLGKRLNFIQDIDEALLANFIPRMALQLLVENAIKHGFGQSAKPETLRISIAQVPSSEHPKAWFLSVQNSGHINHHKVNAGIGLKNLEERLKISFAHNYQLTLTEENYMVDAKILFSY